VLNGTDIRAPQVHHGGVCGIQSRFLQPTLPWFYRLQTRTEIRGTIYAESSRSMKSDVPIEGGAAIERSPF